ncbi:MAG: DUF1934 domain-containing protein [Clostridia bacterium]|nr:DUF1934 domain-containing protein [Clostridia bacterium]
MSSDIKLTLTVNSVIDNLSDTGLPEGEPEINIFTTDGRLTPEPDGYTVRFTEVQEGGEAHTKLLITEGRVRLIKTGAISSEMVFSEGEDFNTLYRVGPYSFDMTVRTKRIRNSLSEDGGELQLIYSMNVGGQEKNVRMKISAKRK